MTLKMVIQQGRQPKTRAKAYRLGYVEHVGKARTTLMAIFSILLYGAEDRQQIAQCNRLILQHGPCGFDIVGHDALSTRLQAG